MKITPKLLLFLILLTCVSTAAADVVLSQFQRASYSDLLIDAAGVYHAVFLESPAIGKPRFVYYTSSSNGGRSWSKPVAISNDGTGNGSAAPRLISDARGEVYAIWKRYGSTSARYPVDDAILEGIGGYNPATLFYATVTGGAPSTPRKVIDKEEAVVSWFPTLDPSGTVTLVWSQISDESHQNNWKVWYYADWIRTAKLQGGAVGNIGSVTRPKPALYKGGAPPDEGFMNLHGYINATGELHFIAEKMTDKSQTIYYSNSRSLKQVYAYPRFKNFNNFNNPARLLVDKDGNEHVILKPDSSMLESEEIWDIDPATGKKTVLVALQQQGIELKGLQAYQGPGGIMTVAFEAGKMSDASEAFLCVYAGGVWKSFGITKNSAKADYDYKEFPFNGSYRPTLSTLRRYDSKFVTVFHDKTGARKMLMTLSEYFSTGSFAIESPSVIFIGGGPAPGPAKPAAPASPPRRRN